MRDEPVEEKTLAQAQAVAGDHSIGLGDIFHFDELGSVPRDFNLVSTTPGMGVTHLRFRAEG